MKKSPKRTQLTKRLQRVQSETEKVISRSYKAALELLPPAPRKVVKDVASQLEATAEEFNERGEKALKTADKQRKALLSRVEKAAKAFERRSGRALAMVETRSAQLVESFQQAAADAVRPIVRRLDIATLSDVENLGRRLAQVERKLTNGRRRAA